MTISARKNWDTFAKNESFSSCFYLNDFLELGSWAAEGYCKRF